MSEGSESGFGVVRGIGPTGTGLLWILFAYAGKQQLISLIPAADHKEIRPRQSRKSPVFAGNLKKNIGRRNHDVQDRLVEEAWSLRHGCQGGFREVYIRDRGEIYNLIEGGIEIRIRRDGRAMAGNLRIGDLSMERRVDNSSLRVDLENDWHKGVLVVNGCIILPQVRGNSR
jgi:hypothetical protein